MLTINHLEIKAISATGLSIEPGDCISLVGVSGMGKSLFLKAVADLILNRGEISLDGVDRNDIAAPDWRKLVTYVGPKSAWWETRVKDHFQNLDWLQTVLPSLELSPKTVDWPVSRLSSGEAQRLCLLRALEGTYKGEVRYFLLDEPTSALDVGRQSLVENFLESYLTARQIAVLFVSHDDRQVNRFATRRWEIYDRRVREVSI